MKASFQELDGTVISSIDTANPRTVVSGLAVQLVIEPRDDGLRRIVVTGVDELTPEAYQEFGNRLHEMFLRANGIAGFTLELTEE